MSKIRLNYKEKTYVLEYTRRSARPFERNIQPINRKEHVYGRRKDCTTLLGQK